MLKLNSKLVLSFLISSLVILVLVFPLEAFAQAGGVTAPPAGGETDRIENPLGASNFTELIGKIVVWIANIGIAVAVIVIIYAGLLFMTSGGNEEKITQAKKALTWSLAILLMGRSGALIALVKDILGMS